MSDERLKIPATRELLDGWCGPALFATPTHVVAVLGMHTRDEAEVCSVNVGKRFVTSLDALCLDLARAECRDRVARVLAAPCTDEVVWEEYSDDLTKCWQLVGRANGFRRLTVFGSGVEPAWVGTDKFRHVPALADLAPSDDTRLPDGSRLVDALALAAVWREVSRG